MKTYKYLILFICMIPLSYSCNDVLDKNDLSGLSSDLVWQDEAYIEAYVSDIYYNLRGWQDTYSGGFRVMDNIADEGRSSYPNFLPNSLMLPGIWTVETDINDMHYWQMYKEIRKCNEFFENMETSDLNGAKIDILTAEVKFIRAFHYFELVKRCGGVPLITVPQRIDDEDIFPSRNSIDECFKFIIDEFDQAAQLFEANDVISVGNGKASQGAALAFKAKSLLYYASPQFNTGADNQRWADAEKAAKEVISLDAYSLHPEFSEVLLSKNNSELIFKKEYKLASNKPGYKYDHGRSTGYLPLGLARGDAGYSYPVQEFVDAFPMADGKEISDPGSGYNPQDPYTGRDPRFYASVVFNGTDYMGMTVNTFIGDATNGMGINQWTTNTAYFCRKNIKENLPDNYWGFRDDDTPFAFMRYTDILLMYAEAKNEASGPDASIIDVIQQIWDRAGITGTVPTGLSKDEMRDFIHNERYVELAFEGHRYWDLRRWKEAQSRLSGSKFHGMQIMPQPDGTFVYTPVEIDIFEPKFEEYMYLMPIPYAEILANPNLKQNPGW